MVNQQTAAQALHTHTHLYAHMLAYTCIHLCRQSCTAVTQSGANTQRNSYSATFCQLLFAWATFVAGREKFSRSQIVCELFGCCCCCNGNRPTISHTLLTQAKRNSYIKKIIKPSRTLLTFPCPCASVKCNGQKVERISSSVDSTWESSPTICSARLFEIRTDRWKFSPKPNSNGCSNPTKRSYRQELWENSLLFPQSRKPISPFSHAFFFNLFTRLSAHKIFQSVREKREEQRECVFFFGWGRSDLFKIYLPRCRRCCTTSVVAVGRLLQLPAATLLL